MTENIHAQPRILKIVVNMGTGEAGDRLLNAQAVMEELTSQKPIRTISGHTNKDFKIRKEMPIGCKVTLRGERAADFLKRALWVRENQLPGYSIDSQGNLHFGVADHTDFEGMKYDPSVGIFGMDVSVVIGLGGYRVSQRRRHKVRMPQRQRVTREGSRAWLEEAHGITFLEVN